MISYFFILPLRALDFPGVSPHLNFLGRNTRTWLTKDLEISAKPHDLSLLKQVNLGNFGTLCASFIIYPKGSASCCTMSHCLTKHIYTFRLSPIFHSFIFETSVVISYIAMVLFLQYFVI